MTASLWARVSSKADRARAASTRRIAWDASGYLAEPRWICAPVSTGRYNTRSGGAQARRTHDRFGTPAPEPTGFVASGGCLPTPTNDNGAALIPIIPQWIAGRSLRPQRQRCQFAAHHPRASAGRPPRYRAQALQRAWIGILFAISNLLSALDVTNVHSAASGLRQSCMPTVSWGSFCSHR